MNNFKNNLKRLRKENNLTQTELGEKLNLKQRTYSAYELGDNEPSIDILIDIADFFNISVDELIR